MLQVRSLDIPLSINELLFVQGVIQSTLRQKLFMATSFNDLTIIDHIDPVSISNGAQSVGDHQRRSVAQ